MGFNKKINHINGRTQRLTGYYDFCIDVNLKYLAINNRKFIFFLNSIDSPGESETGIRRLLFEIPTRFK